MCNKQKTPVFGETATNRISNILPGRPTKTLFFTWVLVVGCRICTGLMVIMTNREYFPASCDYFRTNPPVFLSKLSDICVAFCYFLGLCLRFFFARLVETRDERVGASLRHQTMLPGPPNLTTARWGNELARSLFKLLGWHRSAAVGLGCVASG